MIRWLANLISLQEKREFRGETVVFFAIFVGAMRLFLEFFLVGYQGFVASRDMLLYSSWYLMCFFVFGLPVRLLAPPPWQRRINVMLVGLFLGFLPPVVDVLVGGWGDVVIGERGFRYSYVRDFPEGWPWGMIDADKHMPVGEGVILWSAVAFTGAYLRLRTRSIGRTVAGLVLAYGACAFVGGVVPTFTSRLRQELAVSVSSAWLLVVVQSSIAFLLYFLVYRPSVAKLVFSRFVHALPLVSVSLVGYAWIRPIDARAALSVALISLCGVVTILENDHWDDQEERPGEPERIARYDVVVAYCVFVLITLTLFALGSMLAVLLSIYGVASHLYNSPVYRGKRYFPANLKLEGLWGGVAFLLGVLAAAIPELLLTAASPGAGPRVSGLVMTPFSRQYGVDVAIAAFLAFGGWSVLASTKDEKDVAVDESLGSQTVFTILVRRGVAESTVARWVRGVAFAGMAIGAWAPLLVARSSIQHAILMTAIAVPAAFFRGSTPSGGFRARLGLVTLLLFVLAHGASGSHL